MKTPLLVIVSAFAFTFSQAAEPASFKGVPFGTGCASFFQQYKPGGTWLESGKPASIMWSDSEQALIATPPSYIVGAFPGARISNTAMAYTDDSVAGVKADTRFVFSSQNQQDSASLKLKIDRWSADRAPFSSVEATFESRDADKVLAALIEKYGQPTRIEERGLVSRVAGNIKAQAHVWDMSGAVLEFARISPPKGRPLLIMRSTQVKSIAAKAGASDL